MKIAKLLAGVILLLPILVIGTVLATANSDRLVSANTTVTETVISATPAMPAQQECDNSSTSVSYKETVHSEVTHFTVTGGAIPTNSVRQENVGNDSLLYVVTEVTIDRVERSIVAGKVTTVRIWFNIKSAVASPKAGSGYFFRAPKADEVTVSVPSLKTVTTSKVVTFTKTVHSAEHSFEDYEVVLKTGTVTVHTREVLWERTVTVKVPVTETTVSVVEVQREVSLKVLPAVPVHTDGIGATSDDEHHREDGTEEEEHRLPFAVELDTDVLPAHRFEYVRSTRLLYVLQGGVAGGDTLGTTEGVDGTRDIFVPRARLPPLWIILLQCCDRRAPP